jgi:hypothetical protein
VNLNLASVHFATRVWKSRAVRLSRSSRFLMQPAASEMRSSNSSRLSHLSFVNLALRPDPTNKNVTESRLEIPTAPFRQPFRIVHILILTEDTITFQSIPLPTELPYRYAGVQSTWFRLSYCTYLTHYLCTHCVYIKYVGCNLKNSRHPCVYTNNFWHIKEGALFCA